MSDYSVCVLGEYACCLGVPDGHRLFRREALTWDDLAGERLMLLVAGESPVIDAMRADIGANHPSVEVIDAPFFYDEQVFNACARDGFLMEALDAWEGVHPSVATVPMAWDYTMPYGIAYAKEPSEAVRRFVALLAG